MFGRAITFGAPAGSVSGLASASPAPSATNPFLTADQQGSPVGGTSQYTAVSSAANAEILAAPPAGYYNFVRTIYVMNKSGAATAGFQVKENTTRVIAGSTTTALAANGVSSANNGFLVAAALTGFATGTGDLLFIVSYSRIQTTAILSSQLVLTNAYQALFTAPSAGFALIKPINAMAVAFTFHSIAMNADTGAAPAIMLQIVRGVDTYTITNAAVAASSRTTQVSIPDIINGDTIQVKAASAPTAGTLIYNAFMQTVPIVI